MAKPSKQEIATYQQHKADGKYAEAAKVLYPYRANPKIAAAIDKLMAQEKPKKLTNQQGCGFAIIVVFLSCALCWLWVYATLDVAQSNVERACRVANQNGYYCKADKIMKVWPDAVATCEVSTVDRLAILKYELYVICLQSSGVDMGQ